MVHSTARFARIKKVLCVPDPNMCILKSKKEAKKVEAEARKKAGWSAKLSGANRGAAPSMQASSEGNASLQAH